MAAAADDEADFFRSLAAAAAVAVAAASASAAVFSGKQKAMIFL